MDWRDMVAVILASGLSITLVMSIAGLIYRDRPITVQGAEVLSTVCVAMIAILVAYMGRNK